MIAWCVVGMVLSSGYVIEQGMAILDPNLSEFGLYPLVKIGPISIAAYLPVYLIYAEFWAEGLGQVRSGSPTDRQRRRDGG